MSPSEIALGWNQSSDNEVTFEILRSLNGQTFLLHDTVGANVTTYSDTDVVDGTTYYYVVRAVNATGASANSNQASAVAGDPQPPAVPGNLTADAISPTRIQLAWNQSVGSTSYRIERQGPLDSGFILVGTTAQSSYLDLGLTKDTTYNYRVQAVNHVGLSGYSSTATATTPESVPLASLDINTSVSGSTTVITEGRDYDITAGGVNIWGTADSFRYLHGEYSGDFDVLVRVTNASMEQIKTGIMARESLAAESRHVFASISSGDSHRLATRMLTAGSSSNLFKAVEPVLPDVWLRLKRAGDHFTGFYGTDGANWTEMGSLALGMGHTIYLGLAVSAQSTSETGTVMLRSFGDVPGTAPATPTNLEGSALSHTQINLAWNSSTGASNYRLQRRTGDGEFSDIALVAATSFSDTGLTASTAYEYRVIAENEYGASNPSEIIFVTTPPAPTAPGAPSGVQAATFSHSQIDISWNASVGADSYTVQRRAFGGVFENAIEGLTDVTFSDKNLDPATLYEYQIIAVNEIGASSPSSIASASTDPAPTSVPDVPTGLAGSPISADQVDLAWDRSMGAASYRVQRRTPDGIFADVAINVTALTYSDRGLTGGTTYEYRVLAENSHGLSGPSGGISVTTPAPTHTGVDIGGPAVTGSTTPVGSSGDAYDIFAGGTDIIGTADQFHFAHRQLTGDFDMAVRLESLSQADLWSKAGLMARAGLTAASRNVLVLASTAANNEHRFTYRLTDGGETASTGGGAVTYPNAWLRLRRQGNTFTGYRSSDGMNWVVVGTVSIDLPPTLFFGMAVTSHNAALGTTAAFRDLRPTPAPSVPANVIAAPASSDAVNLKWTASNGATQYLIERKGPGAADPFVHVGTTSSSFFRDAGLAADTTYTYRVRAQSEIGLSEYSQAISVHVPTDGTYVGTDIGQPAVPGSSTAVGADGVDMVAGGLDIWGASDQMHFHNARITGDFDFFVRVDSVSLSGSKAGLMARESLDSGSRNIFAALASDDLYRLSRRTTTGGSTSNLFKNVTPTLPDAWLRLRRVGDIFTGYYSTDGAVWVQMKSITWTMPSTLYVGLAAASKSGTAATTVQFRHFGEIPTSPPAAPTGLEALAVSESGIDLTWTATPGVNLYTVQRRLPGGTFTDVVTGLSGTSYSDTGLAAGTTYEYQVLARNVVGLSAPSGTASATTFAPSSAPDAPTGLTVSVVTHDEARLEWNASFGASSYRVQRRAPGGNFADVAAGLTTTSFNDVGLTPGATYEYRVFAENQVGLSPPSEIVSITMPTAWVYAGTDIGGPSQGGSTTRIDDQSYSVTGGGLDIWGKSDQFHFAHRQITGDFDIRVQVTTVSVPQAKAGLMARESLAGDSRNVFAGMGVDDAYRLSRRASTGGTTSNIFKNVTPILPNAWLRLRRVGNVFTGFYSTDGVTWIQMGSTTLAMPQTVYFGMAVSSKSDVQTATAEFRNLGDVLA
jgi:fibronectin type 3 domain-containing protein